MAVSLPIAIAVLIHILFAVAPGMAENKDTYIVHAPLRHMPSHFSSLKEWHQHLVSSIVSRAPRESRDKAAVSVAAQERILYHYGSTLQGFAVPLTANEAAALEATEGVTATLKDGLMQMHTTRTPSFLGLDTWRTPGENQSLWQAAKRGDGVIVGVLDTGIWPERRSFCDEGFSPVPSRWKGACEDSATFHSSSCNRKLIGARAFYKGYEARIGSINETIEFKSPRDNLGHGTHTSSTATGSAVPNASFFHFAAGNACGIAPAARIAMYKVCWLQGCSVSDTLAAFDAAIADGVDIISLSFGNPPADYFKDAIALGSFAAVARGILVSCSAGNAGPELETVANVAPWIFTIAASSIDRTFPAPLILGNGHSLPGLSIYSGKGFNGKQFPLIYAGNAALPTKNASFCLPGSLKRSQIKGKIVFCERGIIPDVTKGFVVERLGGAGMILGSDPYNGLDLVADSYLLPATTVTYTDSNVIKQYMKETSTNATATIYFHGTKSHVRPAPRMAAFSSRGPNAVTPEILKPDITAPGVNILAAWSGAMAPSALGLVDDKRRVEFNIISGTSMSCPHVSGLVALLKAARPTWSTAAVKSALMTSATLEDNTKQPILDLASGQASLPIAHGAGHVNPYAALNPGLIYDLTIQDYVNFLCGQNYSSPQLNLFTSFLGHHSYHDCSFLHPTNLNYPSVSVVYYQSQCNFFFRTFSRIVTNVGPATSTYNVSVTFPTKNVTISVQPSTLSFSYRNQKLSYNITFSAFASTTLSKGTKKIEFGSLTWYDGYHTVRSPIMFTWVNY